MNQATCDLGGPACFAHADESSKHGVLGHALSVDGGYVDP